MVLAQIDTCRVVKEKGVPKSAFLIMVCSNWLSSLDRQREEKRAEREHHFFDRSASTSFTLSREIKEKVGSKLSSAHDALTALSSSSGTG